MPPPTVKPVHEIPIKELADTAQITFSNKAFTSAFTFIAAYPTSEPEDVKFNQVPNVPSVEASGPNQFPETLARRYAAGPGSTLWVSAPNTALIGLGKLTDGQQNERAKVKKVAEALAAFVVAQRPAALNVHVKEISEEAFPYFLAYFKFGMFAEDRFKVVQSKRVPIKCSISFVGRDNFDALMSEGDKIAKTIVMMREISDAPPNYCHPETFKSLAEEMCSGLGLKFKALDFAEAKALGMGGFCAVSQGMTNEPYFLHIQYKNGNPKHRFALVGKGVCMDTGGYAIKPAAAMFNMHHDMGGAATTLSVARLVGLTQPANCFFDFYIPLVENLVDAQAYLNGDLITTMSGLNVLIKNTDAEGRMILCDGIAYAQTEFEKDQEKLPCTVATIATLTGAAIVALGKKMAPFFSTCDDMAEKVKASSDKNWDKVWRFPLDAAYDFKDEDDRCDIANLMTGDGPGVAGCVTAAKFLQAHVWQKDVNFMHFDIAGPMTNGKQQCDGYGPILMTDFMCSI